MRAYLGIPPIAAISLTLTRMDLLPTSLKDRSSIKKWTPATRLSVVARAKELPFHRAASSPIPIMTSSPGKAMMRDKRSRRANSPTSLIFMDEMILPIEGEDSPVSF